MDDRAEEEKTDMRVLLGQALAATCSIGRNAHKLASKRRESKEASIANENKQAQLASKLIGRPGTLCV